MFDHLGALVARRWIWVLLGWLALTVTLRWAAPPWDDVTRDGDFAYLPAGMTSVQGEKLLDAAFREDLARSTVVLVIARDGEPLTLADWQAADRLVAQLTAEAALPESPILRVVSHRTEVIGKKLVSAAGEHGQASLVMLPLRHEFMAVANMNYMQSFHERIDRFRQADDFPEGLQIGLTGSASIGADMLLSAKQSIRNTEWTTIILVVLILVAVYRAPGLVLIPLVTIGVSVMVATDLVALAARFSERSDWLDFRIFTTTRIFVVVILFGAGVDYCLFLIARYRENLAEGLSRQESLGEALGSVGSALAASALTTILGLAVMVVCEFGKFRYSGPAIAVCLTVALAASITLAPALLRATGRVVFWPFGVGRKTSSEVPPSERGLWPVVAKQLLARPGTILLVSLVALLPLVWHGLSAKISYDFLSELNSTCPSVRGTHLLRRYFSAGQTGPIVVLAYDQEGSFDTVADRWERLRQLHDDLLAFEFVDNEGNHVQPIDSVRSLIEPLGDPPEQHGFFESLRRGVVRGNSRTQDTYLAQNAPYAGKVTRFDLVCQYDPFSTESIRLLGEVEAMLRHRAEATDSAWQGTRFYFVGTTAGIRDLRAVNARDRLRLQILVPLAVFIVLVVILRRLWVCLYLILSVLLGYFVTMGVTWLAFSALHGSSFQGLDWKVPIFLFVILIAVGQDYNIYLVTRVFEEQRRRGRREGLRVALIRTGGIITSCGLIMAGTFASMMTGSLRAMHQLGFALSLGVLLDTLIIRTLLVPAMLALIDRRRGDEDEA